MTKPEGIARAADRLADEIIELRRRIHEHPELAFEEHETAARVEEFLKRLGIPCRAGIGRTGDRRDAGGRQAGADDRDPRRHGRAADQRADGLPFASKVAGKMHACGHDAHTAIVLGVAAVLAAMRDASPAA